MRGQGSLYRSPARMHAADVSWSQIFITDKHLQGLGVAGVEGEVKMAAGGLLYGTPVSRFPASRLCSGALA